MVRYLSALLYTLTLLGADVYIVSLKYQVKESMLIHTSLMASPVMTPLPQNTAIDEEIIFLTQECPKSAFFSCYAQEISDYILAHEVHVQSFDKTTLKGHTNLTQLIVPPHYLQVEFNDTLARIALLRVEENLP
ncbi:MAG: hypothetical protein KU37_07695 [Sulfuricurvum sp. PC08-66]|nr:MAG: hypothetical protein KU37_07695 [Sulfuricurvum sp. PC08-66]